ncbi:processed acidic surface protein [Planomicrobium okeanokoites]|uniref:Processed acidic surface protein n=1 Tax=Planomicrobium okeanokoites TaxID=244 RepID=A0ABV7KSC7_PLAOK|nr:processed acidic surface protein [Planomicrobium okeanokoites]TAA70138.1 processed acidic surface protein [Planomicrobium okeanokoites]
MKKLLVLLMAVLLVVSALPASTFAIAKDDPEFEKFLEEINWSKKSYINYLMEKNWSLDDFGDVSELGTPLSEEGVQTVMEDFELTREELNELLVEFGDIEEGEDVLDGTYLIFNEELYFFTEYYLTADFGMIDEDGEEFTAFLESINWTKEDYLAYLDSKDWGLEYFSDVSELGTPLSEEGVQKVMKDFDLTREELNALLVEYGDIEEGQDVLDSNMYIIFNEDLYFYVEWYLDDENYIDLNDLDIFTEVGLTEEELDRLFEHFITLNFEDETFLDQLDALLQRLDAVPYFESADDLDAEEIAILLDIFDDMMNLFEVETKYYLTDGTEKTALTLTALLALETTNGKDLLIEIFDREGTFLADIVLTAEMFGSEIIEETGKDLEVVEEVIAAPVKETKEVKKEVKSVKKDTKAVQTTKGGKLPKTATDYVSNTLVGFAFVLIGFLLFRRMKTVSN